MNTKVVFRFFLLQIAFWVAAVLGSLSVYFNIQHQKSSSASTSRSAELGGGVYERQRQQQQQQQHVGLINDGMAKTGTSSVGVVEMTSKGSKRGSRGSSSRRKRGSSNGGGYARVNGDADWDDDEMDGGGGGGAHGLMDSEEEVDLGLVSLTLNRSNFLFFYLCCVSWLSYSVVL